ncbi:MAG: hypothetical protein HYZ16_07120 [Bacteroidetes bacterium]|nr:hypothetical protein [Bacteroidota bacterium]
MPLTTTYLHIVEHPWGLHAVHPPKHVVTADSATESSLALYDFIKRTGKNHVLIEAQGSTVSMGLRDLSKVFKRLIGCSARGLNVAVVLPNHPKRLSMIPMIGRFSATMGINFKAFTDKTMAMRWLIASN